MSFLPAPVLVAVHVGAEVIAVHRQVKNCVAAFIVHITETIILLNQI
ncbi:MAG: hypothetical protein AB9891_12705 [Anaerolineaceae bacterium]